MQAHSSDTSPEIDEMQIELLRQAGPGRRGGSSSRSSSPR